MYYQHEVNILVSGWISTGVTTTSLILSYLLQKKFIYAGGTHKFIAKELGYDPASPDFVEYEIKYGEKWDILWEEYIAWKIVNEKNLLVNSKIAGFFAEPKPWLFEIFVIADVDTRRERAGGDERSEDIAARDKELSERWNKLFKVQFMDVDELRETHDLVLDNSDLSISETLDQILRSMKRALDLRQMFLLSDLEKVEKIALEKGKSFFYDKLEEKGLVISTEEIFKDWTTNLKFKKLLEQTEPEWQEVVYKNIT